MLLKHAISKAQWIKQQRFISCPTQSEIGEVSLGSSSFLTLLAWSLSLSASLAGMREAWKVLGEFMAKAEVVCLTFVHNPLARTNSIPWFHGDWEVKLSCVSRRKRNLFGGHKTFSQLQCAMHLVNPHNNPVNGFITPLFFLNEEIKT